MKFGFNVHDGTAVMYDDVHLVLDARALDNLVYLGARAFGAEEFRYISLKREARRAKLEYRVLEAIARRRAAARLAQFRKGVPVNFLRSDAAVELRFHRAADVARQPMLRPRTHERGDELFRIIKLGGAVSFCDEYRHVWR